MLASYIEKALNVALKINILVVSSILPKLTSFLTFQTRERTSYSVELMTL